jgi:CRP-like cAMP-binding protein
MANDSSKAAAAELLSQLQKVSVLAPLGVPAAEHVLPRVQVQTFQKGERVVREGDATRDLYFLLQGTAHVTKDGTSVQTLSPGAEFGTLSLVTGRPRAATVEATTPLTVARLSVESWKELAARQPDLAFRLLEALFARVREDLVTMTQNVTALLSGRSVPRSAVAEVTLGGVKKTIPTGTVVRDLLPHDVNGDLVVGGLLGEKPVGLHTPVFADATLSPPVLSRHSSALSGTRAAGELTN